MALVTGYRVGNFGSSDGFQNNRAEIQLMNGSTVLGWVRFHDPETPFAEDTEVEGKIIMHVPSAMFATVLDVLRNEKSINYHFALGRAVLSTSDQELEPTGEDE